MLLWRQWTWQRWAWLAAFLTAVLLTVTTWWGWVPLVLVTWALIVAA